MKRNVFIVYVAFLPFPLYRCGNSSQSPAVQSRREPIRNEIARLDATRTEHNPLMVSSEPKIQILSHLLHLLAIPDHLTFEEHSFYFGQERQMPLSLLIERLLESEQFPASYHSGEGNVNWSNRSIIERQRSLLPLRAKGKTSTARFLESLKSTYGNVQSISIASWLWACGRWLLCILNALSTYLMFTATLPIA